MLPRQPGVLRARLVLGVHRGLAVHQEEGGLSILDGKAEQVVGILSAAARDDPRLPRNAGLPEEVGEASSACALQGVSVATTFDVELHHRVPPISPLVQS